jgi:hypothetical protein
MPSRACIACHVNWPVDPERPTDCPRCGAATQLHNAEPEVDVKHARFERAYRQHEADRAAEGELSPDVQGRLEAREQLGKRRR